MIGIHVSRTKSFPDKQKKYKSAKEAIIEESQLFNLSACQIFVTSPMSRKRVTMDYAGIKKYTSENNIEMHIHASYIAVDIWNTTHNNKNENKSLLNLRHIRDMLIDGKQLGSKSVVIHLSRHPIERAIETMEVISSCNIISKIKEGSGELPGIYLEMPASKPHDELTYETPEKLSVLCEALNNNKAITYPWYICIDTCHQYAGGVNYSAEGSWDEWYNALSNVTKEKLKLIHLNGAEMKNFGRGKDGHVIPFSPKDDIWGKFVSNETRAYLETLSENSAKNINLWEKLSKKEKDVLRHSGAASIIRFAKEKNISMICEIKTSDFIYAKFAIDVINGLLS